MLCIYMVLCMFKLCNDVFKIQSETRLYIVHKSCSVSELQHRGDAEMTSAAQWVNSRPSEPTSYYCSPTVFIILKPEHNKCSGWLIFSAATKKRVKKWSAVAIFKLHGTVGIWCKQHYSSWSPFLFYYTGVEFTEWPVRNNTLSPFKTSLETEQFKNQNPYM